MVLSLTHQTLHLWVIILVLTMALFPFFLFLDIFFVKLTLAVTLRWTNIPSDGGHITPKFLSGIIISP